MNDLIKNLILEVRRAKIAASLHSELKVNKKTYTKCL